MGEHSEIWILMAFGSVVCAFAGLLSEGVFPLSNSILRVEQKHT